MSVQQIIFNKSTAVCTTTQTYDMGRHSCSSTHSTWALSPLVRVFSLSLLVAVSPSISTLPRTHPCILRSCFSELTSLQDPPTPHTDVRSLTFHGLFLLADINHQNKSMFVFYHLQSHWVKVFLAHSLNKSNTHERAHVHTDGRAHNVRFNQGKNVPEGVGIRIQGAKDQWSQENTIICDVNPVV